MGSGATVATGRRVFNPISLSRDTAVGFLARFGAQALRFLSSVAFFDPFLLSRDTSVGLLAGFGTQALQLTKTTCLLF